MNFRFECGQKVGIAAVGENGQIAMRRDAFGQHDYLVIYWMDGQRREEWMNDWELEK